MFGFLPIVWRNLHSKFGHNLKSTIYGSINVYWICPKTDVCVEIDSKEAVDVQIVCSIEKTIHNFHLQHLSHIDRKFS